MEHIKPLLELAALILGLANGLILLWNFLRDRAIISAGAIHPEFYQWWFELPSREHEGQMTRAYGFISYIGISNSGLRDVTINRWRLHIRLRNREKQELKPLNLPEPQIRIGGHIKSLQIFGQKGQNFEGDMNINSGGSISGLSYYIYECYGDPVWDPPINNDHIVGKITIKSVFNNRATCEVNFRKRTLEEIRDMFPGIQELIENR